MSIVGESNSAQQPIGSGAPASTNLADVLERVLDKGLVIAGDIRVNLLDIELLTIKLRLVIASLETAKEVGIDWWEHDPWLSGDRAELEAENRELRRRITELESAVNGEHELEEAPESAEADREAAAEGERRG
jgi:hypothetical protein